MKGKTKSFEMFTRLDDGTITDIGLYEDIDVTKDDMRIVRAGKASGDKRANGSQKKRYTQQSEPDM